MEETLQALFGSPNIAPFVCFQIFWDIFPLRGDAEAFFINHPYLLWLELSVKLLHKFRLIVIERGHHCDYPDFVIANPIHALREKGMVCVREEPYAVVVNPALGTYTVIFRFQQLAV